MTPRSEALVVDPFAGDGYGYCVELVPEWIAADEWGFPVLRRGTLPPELIDLVRRAIADCLRRMVLAANPPLRTASSN